MDNHIYNLPIHSQYLMENNRNRKAATKQSNQTFIQRRCPSSQYLGALPIRRRFPTHQSERFPHDPRDLR